MGTSEELASNESEQSAEAKETESVNKVSAEEITSYSQAPELEELVESGELEPLEERMPVAEDIMVEGVEEEIGVYGGALRMPWKGQMMSGQSVNQQRRLSFGFRKMETKSYLTLRRDTT